MPGICYGLGVGLLLPRVSQGLGAQEREGGTQSPRWTWGVRDVQTPSLVSSSGWGLLIAGAVPKGRERNPKERPLSPAGAGSRELPASLGVTS